MNHSDFGFIKIGKLVLALGAYCFIVGAGGCPGNNPAPAGPPIGGPFSFTADMSSVNIPQNVMSGDVTFTLTSDGTFSGQVLVTWTATGDCSPSPSTNDVTLAVAPGAPTTFTRKMYRWADNGRNVRFTAHHAGTNTTRNVDIAFTHP